MTTATKESKSTRKRKDAQGAAATGDAGTPASTDLQALTERLGDLGFVVPVYDLGKCVEEFRNQIDSLISGRPLLAPVRQAVLDWLLKFEALSPEQVEIATETGRLNAKMSADMALPKGTLSNPFFAGSLMAKSWQQGYDNPEVNGSPPDLTTPANAKELADKTKPKTAPKVDPVRQQELAIEAALADLEDASNEQTELKRDCERLKSRLKATKADYDDAVQRGQEAGQKLRDARNGNFQPSLPFPRDKTEKPSVPDQDIGGPPAAMPEDHGAKMDLSCLKKGDLQKQTGCDAELGLSAKQIEKLKESVGGSTIADLEKFQREQYHWEGSVTGFGEETITKLQDAHLALRLKFPMPTANDSVEAGAVMTDGEAIKRLSSLIDQCDDLADELESEEGVTFLESVAEGASEMRANVLKHNSVTPAQETAIVNWEGGVAKWADAEELEVPDEDGDE